MKSAKWIPVEIEICFERKEMRRLFRTGRVERRTIVTPRIRFSDGSTMRGARVPEALAEKVERLARKLGRP